MTTEEAIARLADYGIEKKLLAGEDRIWTVNRLLEILNRDTFTEPDGGPEKEAGKADLPELLKVLTDEAWERGLLPDNGITQRDLFDTKLMGALTGRPSEIRAEFARRYAADPVQATDWFYEFSQNTNYIRRDRIARDRRWTVSSPYGMIDITINLSKPEKDPKAIAAAKNAPQTAYPKCQLCMENEGYRGRIDHPARQNHRIIPVKVLGQDWGFQYSPYVYYREHCIVFNGKHVPMKICRETFEKLFSFVDQFPHYFLGSNADLPIVGGSILSHDHFQGGHYTFAMERAGLEWIFTVPGYERVRAGIVHWPLSVIRLDSEDQEQLIDLADHILTVWRAYSDPESRIYAETEGEAHNTITPIARKHGQVYELDLALRNNITTAECPLGLFHPHAEYHHIKKENIGLIEVMGLAVLPARLNREMALLKACLMEGRPVETEPELASHAPWVRQLQESYPVLRGKGCSPEEIDAILQEEIGQVFVKVLEDAGVYKCSEAGRAGFRRFINSL